MKRSSFSDEQIVGILKEQEAGALTADVCRRHGISEAIFYKLCVVDDFTRECLALVPDTSLSGARVARELDMIAAIRGKPLGGDRPPLAGC